VATALEGVDGPTLLAQADEAMYLAKGRISLPL